MIIWSTAHFVSTLSTVLLIVEISIANVEVFYSENHVAKIKDRFLKQMFMSHKI